jgi:hypothetical protein
VFALATAVIMAHILFVSLAAVEPGASRVDHLLGAFVSLSVGALFVWLYPRLRMGLRAIAALVFGLLALVSAALVIKGAAAAGRPKTLWEIPGAGHTGGLKAQPQQYEQRVIAFFERALLGALA